MADVASLNQCIVAGEITSDITVRNMDKKGTPLATFSVLTLETEIYSKKLSNYFHQVLCLGNAAIYVNRYAKKGSYVFVVGKHRPVAWQDKNGNTRKSCNIVAETIIIAKYHPFKKQKKGLVEQQKPSKTSSPPSNRHGPKNKKGKINGRK